MHGHFKASMQANQFVPDVAQASNRLVIRTGPHYEPTVYWCVRAVDATTMSPENVSDAVGMLLTLNNVATRVAIEPGDNFLGDLPDEIFYQINDGAVQSVANLVGDLIVPAGATFRLGFSINMGYEGSGDWILYCTATSGTPAQVKNIYISGEWTS